MEENKTVPHESDELPREVEKDHVLGETLEEHLLDKQAPTSFSMSEETTEKCSTSVTSEPGAIEEPTFLPISSQALSLDEEEISDERLGQFEVKILISDVNIGAVVL